MKYIVKSIEPRELVEHRATPGADFDGCPKESIRDSLIAEQKGLCAYCLSRISPDWNQILRKCKTEIEHYRSQDANPDLHLTYTNLLGVCHGNAGQGKHKFHCDKSKDLLENKPKLPLTLNPLYQSCERITCFDRQGRINSDDPVIRKDIEVLNLNEQALVNNRKAVITEIYRRLKDRHNKRTGHSSGNWKSQIIRKELSHWSNPINNQFKEFCQTAIYFLNRELAKVHER